MKVRALIGSLGLALLAASLGRSAEERPVAAFKISVAVSSQKNEVTLKCAVGCGWTELTFACPQSGECSSLIDENGMAEER